MWQCVLGELVDLMKNLRFEYVKQKMKVIVEDELLNFSVIKIKTLSHSEIVLLVSNNFSSE